MKIEIPKHFDGREGVFKVEFFPSADKQDSEKYAIEQLGKGELVCVQGSNYEENETQ